jgi:hypothetical protein
MPRPLHLILLVVLSVLLTQDLVLDRAHAATTQPTRSQRQSTRVMQQSDYRNRLDQEKQEKIDERQVASVAAGEPSSAGLDYAVLIILVASAVAVLFLSRVRRASRRFRHRL